MRRKIFVLRLSILQYLGFARVVKNGHTAPKIMRVFSLVLILLCGVVFGVPVATAQVVNFDTEIREKWF